VSGSLRARVDLALDRLRLRGCDRVGPGVRLDGAPAVDNAGRLLLGRDVWISSRPVQTHLVVAPGATLELGDGVVVGHGAALAAFAQVRIGDGARLAPFASISDTDFHVAGRRDARPEATPVLIGKGVRLGSRVTVLRGATIGDGAVVAAGSVVSGHVPPGASVGGVPARLLAPGGAAPASEDGSLDRLPAVVAEALGLRQPPPLSAGRAGMPEWDSLGALRVMLAVEEAFDVTLDEDGVASVREVGDLAGLVRAARACRAGG
jgi:acetyltransferase-like isoleucine patch superfamily enzyme/acyl carrier protein